MQRYLILGFFSTLLFGGAIGYFFGYDHGVYTTKVQSISSFEECKAAGYPIMESYPEQCRTKGGKMFVRDVDDAPTPPSEESVVCTMDAKLCPDGSAVERAGPDCEFLPCPGEELPY